MVVANRTEAIRRIGFFQGLTEEEITQVTDLCKEHSYKVGELCQTEGQRSEQVHFILKGRVGTVIHIPNVTYISNEIILDTLHDGDAFGWSSLIRGTPWSTLRVLEPTDVLSVNSADLIGLCEKNSHIGYVLMRNLSALIASRLRRNRMSILNAIVAIRGEW
jgi:CRP/FNR family transcriptional regulator